MSASVPQDQQDDAKEAVEKNRDLLERIADADLAISEDIERVLEIVDGYGGEE